MQCGTANISTNLNCSSCRNAFTIAAVPRPQPPVESNPTLRPGQPFNREQEEVPGLTFDKLEQIIANLDPIQEEEVTPIVDNNSFKLSEIEPKPSAPANTKKPRKRKGQ